VSRPSLDEYLMSLAAVAALRTTCIRRGVGCVLADAHGRVLSVGYNGVARGQPHCNEGFGIARPGELQYFPHACKGHDLPPGQDSCEAIHAEQNALVQCREPDLIVTAYVTLSPCKACTKLLLGTMCTRIVFLEEHTDLAPMELWRGTGRTVERLPRSNHDLPWELKYRGTPYASKK